MHFRHVSDGFLGLFSRALDLADSHLLEVPYGSPTISP